MIDSAQNGRYQEDEEVPSKSLNAEGNFVIPPDVIYDIFDTLHDFYFHLESDGTIVGYKAKHPEDLYVDPNEFIGKRMQDVLPEDVGIKFDNALQQMIATGKMATIEYSLVIGDESNYYEAKILPLPLNRAIAIVSNVSDLRRTHQRLAISQKDFQGIVENATIAVFRASVKGYFLIVNPKMAEMFGYNDPDEMIREVRNIPDDLFVSRARREELLHEMFTTGRGITSREVEYRRKDGSVFHANLSARLVRDDNGTLMFMEGFIEDITDRKQAYQALEQSRERYRKLIETALDAILLTDIEGTVLLGNGLAAGYFGFDSVDELSNAHVNVSRLLSESDYNKKNRFINTILRDGGVRNVELTMRTLDNKSIPVEINASLIRNLQSEPAGIVSVIRDVSERKNMLAALRTSEEFNRELVTQSPVGIAYVTNTGTLLFANPSVRSMLGMSHLSDENIEGQSVLNFVGERRPTLEKELHRIFSGEHSRVENIQFVTPEGRKKYFNFYGAPIYRTNREVGGAVLMIIDITDQKELEIQLRHSQKMEAIGTLAGGIAHDFNNLLTVISGYTEMSLLNVDPKNPLFADLREIEKAVDSASALTRQLLVFSRQQETRPKILNLNKSIQYIEKMLRRLIGTDVSLVTDLQPSLGSVNIDPGHVEQILVNLTANARDAMPEGGAFTIATRQVTFDGSGEPPEAQIPHGEYILLQVKDTGMGMSREVVEKAFDPFFTTKEAGKGTGLGLATVYGIVHQAHGHILLRSRVDEGTEVSIFLPIVPGQGDVHSVEKSLTELPSGTETILAVEDEESVGNVTLRILKHLGYKVIPAHSGREALEKYEVNHEKIDLVLSDVLMPEMRGDELVEHLTRRWPDVNILLVSGYTSDIMRIQPDSSFNSFPMLRKPYSARELAQKVREVLDSHR